MHHLMLQLNLESSFDLLSMRALDDMQVEMPVEPCVERTCVEVHACA